MKKQANRLGVGKSNFLFAFLIISLCMGFTLRSQDLVSGRTFYDFALDYSSSGNGHSAFIAPSLVLNKNYNAFSIAPLIYSSDKKMSGLKMMYSRNLTGKIKDDYEIVCLSKADSLDFAEMLFYKKTHRDLLQINIYTYLQYNKAIGLDNAFAEYEYLTNAEKDVNWYDVKVATSEAGFGVQLQYNISNSFACKFYSGLSAFHHFDCAHQLQNGNDGVSLNLGIGLFYTFEIVHQKAKRHN